MKYASLPQGICPLGWHVATDEDFINLEGSLDTQYDTLASIWDSTGFRGLDAGLRLRSATGWLSGGNGTDVAGFSAEPGGGAFGSTASFNSLGTAAMFWTSTTESTGASYGRYLEATSDQVYRGGFQRVNAFSVRCVKD